MKRTQKRNATYTVGTVINGKQYVYTGLGVFKTVAAAVNRCGEQKALVFEQWEMYSASSPVCFGYSESVAVASCLGGPVMMAPAFTATDDDLPVELGGTYVCKPYDGAAHLAAIRARLESFDSRYTDTERIGVTAPIE